LIILEAYLGRYDHILHIDSGLVEWKEPTNVSEYESCQVIPVDQQLQMLVQDSKLAIEHSMFKKKENLKEEEKTEFIKLYPEINNGMFIPCSIKTKALLYVKFTY